MEWYAEVILNSDAVEIDKPFTYKIPEEFVNIIKVGHIVKVPFGLGNKLIIGFVYKIISDKDINVNFKVKNIVNILYKEPLITTDDIKLIEFLRQNYLCKYIDGFRLLIPTGILKGAKVKKKSVVVFVHDDLNGIKNSGGYAEILEIVKNNNGKFTKSDIIKNFNISQYKMNKLIQLGLLKTEDEVVFRYNAKVYKEDHEKSLTGEQQNAFNKITSSHKKIFLLKGVTGSGKTEIYMRLVEKALNEGKSSIILVPEISLTPQMIERFKGRFGINVALFHSKLSEGERFDEWYRVKNGQAKVIVGARSALFLPAEKLGLIIIDEEHETTYKSEQNPKYQAKEVAEFLSNQKGCKVILGSATPTIDTYYRAISGDIELVELNNRVDGKPMPTMDIVDMREELKSGNKSIFSRVLFNEINKKLSNNEQIILFLNRRGFSTFVSCRNCGYVFKCEDCDISMTYHKNGYLVCHYCGKTKKEVKICPKCESKYIKFFGAGTEKVEEEVRKYFKDARIMRMDVDTTRTKNSHEKIYNSFKNREADILIGTQMISKGLDFPNVTLVGVLAADMSINIPDYRAAERTFQIITQVAGRAGRGEKEGKVIIQTYTPENYSLNFAKNYDYEGFYEKEFTTRAIMNYPPFSKILLINGVSKNETLLREYMIKLGNIINKNINEDVNVELLGPIPCLVSKIKENFRWQIVIKGEFTLDFAKKIKEILYDSNKNVYNDIRISIDINPNNLL